MKQKPFENYSWFISALSCPTPTTSFSPTCLRFDPEFSLFRVNFWLFLPSLLCSSPSVNNSTIPDCSQADGHTPPPYVHNHCTLSFWSIFNCRMQFTYQPFVSWRSLHRRFQLSLELSFVSYLLGKTKVEKIRICENYIFFISRTWWTFLSD